MRIRAYIFMVMMFCILLNACANKAQQVPNADPALGFNYNDIKNIVDKNVSSLLQQDFVKNMKHKKVLMISNIVNETNEAIKISFLTQDLARALRKETKFIITDAINSNIEKLGADIKGRYTLDNDKDYNETILQQKDTLVAPEFLLSGNISKTSSQVDKVTSVDFVVIFTLTDAKTGSILWRNKEIINKFVDKSKVKTVIEYVSETAEKREYSSINNISNLLSILGIGYINVAQEVGVMVDVGFIGLPSQHYCAKSGLCFGGKLRYERFYKKVEYNKTETTSTRFGVEFYYHPAFTAYEGFQILSPYIGGGTVSVKNVGFGKYIDAGFLIVPSLPLFFTIGYRADFLPNSEKRESFMFSVRTSAYFLEKNSKR